MDSQIEALNEQLRAKDMQIADLNERLKNEQQLHKNAQELHAGQLMLTDKKKPGLFDRLFKKKQAAASDPGDDPTGDTPASWKIARIFGKCQEAILTAQNQIFVFSV